MVQAGSREGRARLCVLGHPVSHSRSPAMHTAALRALGMEGTWSYEAIDVAPEELASRVRALPGEGFRGANVTIPHKQAALALAVEASSRALQIGAANTLSFETEGIRADNTDAEGLLGALGEPVAGRHALVLGAGGAARACVWALVEGGGHVAVWNRTADRARALCEELGGEPVEGTQIDTAAYDLIVNTTAIGMDGTEQAIKALPLDADEMNAPQVVVDLAYRPNTDTPLINAAKARGARTIDGLEVLVHQGAASLRLWTGVEPPLDAMRRGARGS